MEDKDYIEAFNQGYELARELGLKSNILKGVNAGKNRIEALKDGMEQFEKELELEKSKEQGIIPPLNLDSIGSNYIDLDSDEKDKDKGIDMDI
ncbi:hypothetical protein [uncultured Croceitalea sp.]|uniref:hypothetical protein n=1 Tax=uncultured Croceitalea sp. TaxID=1798908 RepID=UPI00374F52A6